jgi:hypothetical protein
MDQDKSQELVTVTLTRERWRMIEHLTYTGTMQVGKQYINDTGHTSECLLQSVLAFEALVTQLKPAGT